MSETNDEDEYYNPNYNKIECILGFKKRKYLCKWTDLPYAQCTWEKKSNLEELAGNKEDLENLIEQYENKKKRAKEGKKKKLIKR